jgi:hypothetical protein
MLHQDFFTAYFPITFFNLAWCLVLISLLLCDILSFPVWRRVRILLQVVRGDRKGTQNLRWDSNVWLWVLRDSDHSHVALQIADPSTRHRGRPKTKSKAIVRQKKEKRNIWSWARKGCPTPRWIGRLIVGHNINSTRWIVHLFRLVFSKDLTGVSLPSQIQFPKRCLLLFRIPDDGRSSETQWFWGDKMFSIFYTFLSGIL